MTLEQLRIFVAVAERQHMTRAAEALHLTQSATSAAIYALENRHAVVLFDRIGRRIALTEAGRLFLDEAKSVLARADAAELALSELGGLKRGSLTIQASQTIAGYWLPRYLARFREAHPMIEIRLGIGNTAQVAKAVAEGDADLGFVEGHIDEPTLASRIVAEDRLALIVGADHPWAGRVGAGRTRIEPGELLSTRWVLREPGSGTRSEFEAALRRFDIDPRRLETALELPSNEAVRAAVIAGAGATVISELVIAAGLRAGLLVRLELDLPNRPFHALRHRERYRTKAGEALLEIIADADQ